MLIFEHAGSGPPIGSDGSLSINLGKHGLWLSLTIILVLTVGANIPPDLGTSKVSWGFLSRYSHLLYPVPLRFDAGFASLTKFETYVAAQGSSPVTLTLESEAKKKKDTSS